MASSGTILPAATVTNPSRDSEEDLYQSTDRIGSRKFYRSHYRSFDR